jgi:arginine decarboxylase
MRRYEEQLAADTAKPPSDDQLLERRLIPDPARARVRVYATQSTHKTLTALRQGSMIHVFDQDFDQKVAEPFHEAYMAHTSTSPNYQILASLDLGRRQVALLSKYMRCLRTSDLIPDEFRPSAIAQPLRSGLRNMMAAWDQDEFVLDPSRITLFIGPTGYDGDTFKRQQLMDRYGIQINKTSRNSVLFMTNIGTTRSSVAFLVEVLVNIGRELDEDISEMSLGEREHFEKAVYRLTEMSLPLPDFSGFHPAFLDHSGREATPEGDVRRAFYLSYDDTNCEYLTGERIDERLDAGVDIVSATYVTPYPPGFPVLVPGQVFSREILQFMRDLDTPEIHGYLPEFGYRVYTEKAIDMVSESIGLMPNGHRAAVQLAAPAPQKAPKKKSAKRGGPDGDRKLPEVGHDELLGQQQPGDAVEMTSS